MREALRLIGPLTGAALFAAFGGPAIVLLDIVNLPALRRLPRCHAPARNATAAQPSCTSSPRLPPGAVTYCAYAVLRTTVVATVITMLAIGISESVYFAVDRRRASGTPVTFIGVLSSIQGVGAIVGGLAITSLIARTGELRPSRSDSL